MGAVSQIRQMGGPRVAMVADTPASATSLQYKIKDYGLKRK